MWVAVREETGEDVHWGNAASKMSESLLICSDVNAADMALDIQERIIVGKWGSP